MNSPIEIANMALSHLGQGVTIVSFTERSPAAKAINMVYETARKKCLRDYRWPFATQYAALSLVAANPNSEWAFSYRYPVNCVMFRKLLSSSRNLRPDEEIPYRIARDSSGMLIFTDLAEAECEYTLDISDASKYPEDFALALSFLVAFFAAPRITRGDPFKIKQDCYALYKAEINNSNANARNEERKDPDPTDEFTAARR